MDYDLYSVPMVFARIFSSVTETRFNLTGSGRRGRTDGTKTERTKNGENSVKRERELHFATVINKRLQRLHNQKEDEKITNTQKKANAEYNNDGDY